MDKTAKGIYKGMIAWQNEEIEKKPSESPSLIAAPLPDCDICHQHQTEPGALKISAPRKIDGLEGLWYRKTHVCVRCIREEK